MIHLPLLFCTASWCRRTGRSQPVTP